MPRSRRCALDCGGSARRSEREDARGGRGGAELESGGTVDNILFLSEEIPFLFYSKKKKKPKSIRDCARSPNNRRGAGLSRGGQQAGVRRRDARHRRVLRDAHLLAHQPQVLQRHRVRDGGNIAEEGPRLERARRELDPAEVRREGVRVAELRNEGPHETALRVVQLRLGDGRRALAEKARDGREEAAKDLGAGFRGLVELRGVRRHVHQKPAAPEPIKTCHVEVCLVGESLCFPDSRKKLTGNDRRDHTDPHVAKQRMIPPSLLLHKLLLFRASQVGHTLRVPKC
mmetsp:Transcript_19813/g.49240  ORF Transcript_19813/g.49240 Transcript_19813/m.49240 type:complete len:286 (+) Transcript_19813:567-1424(+)